jgi:tetratricopeptide (TPR) repeat protein
MNHRTRPALVLPALVLALFGACESIPKLPGDTRGKVEQREQDVQWMIRRGRFAEAVREAEALYRASPDDPAAFEDYRYASTAALLDQGRRALFDRRVDEALALFEQAREISPEPEVPQAWIDNANHQLAMYWHDQGVLAQVGEELEQARGHYEKALEHEPGYGRARAGLIRVLLQMNYRAGMSEEYYDQGVRAFGELQLDEAHQYFSYSKTYNKENERAVTRREETRTYLATRRVFLAGQLEEERNFAAAYNEYRIALLLDPDLEEALVGAERMERERDAAELLREADRGIMRSDYEAASAAVAQGRLLTELQVQEFDDMEVNIEQARLGDKYEEARTLESDQQYDRAVEAYAELLKEAPFFRDAITRKDTLTSYVEEAKQLYHQAMKAETDSQKAKFLRRIEVFWPEYQDVRALLRELDGEGR